MGTTIRPPRSLLLPAIFLYGYIKLAETHSTVLGGATAMIRPMETIVRTLRPIWGDIIQLLVSLLSPEDRHRILNEARKWFKKRHLRVLQTHSGGRTSRPR